MIIILALIGFGAILALILYIPYRQFINDWFKQGRYRSSAFLVVAVIIVVVAASVTGYFLLTRNKSPDSGLATPETNDTFSESAYTLAIGTDLPSLELADTEGKLVNLADYSDKLMIISFWSTVCEFCDKQLPVFQELVEETEGETEIFLVNIFEPADVVKEYKDTNNIPFPVLVDSEGKTAELFQIRGTPTNYFVRHGIVCANMSGAISMETLVDTLKECKIVVPDREEQLKS